MGTEEQSTNGGGVATASDSLTITDNHELALPILKDHGKYAAWSRILGHDFESLRVDEKAGRKTVLDTYGAINPAEFFAVVTECFFEKPTRLRKKHPELYDQLVMYYHLDPEAALDPKNQVETS